MDTYAGDQIRASEGVVGLLAASGEDSSEYQSIATSRSKLSMC